MGLFVEYVERRKTRELAELCVQHGIDLAPLVEELDHLMCDTDSTPEEIYREFLQRAANWAGNLAGRAVTGIGNIAKSFGQGWRQGRGHRQPNEPQVQQPQVQQPQVQQPQVQLEMPQSQSTPTQKEQPSLQMVIHHLQSLGRNLQVLAQGSQKHGELDTAQALLRSTNYLDQISQMIQQVLSSRHGIT